MEQKKIQLSSIELSYYESSGTGVPIVLVHGNSSSGRTFTKQMGGDLGATHRVIAIDLPGHGDSGQFSDLSQYSMPGYAAVVAEFAEAAGVQAGAFVGWSLGGHIVLEAQKLLTQAAGFVIYGTPPLAFPPAMEDAFLPNPAMGVGFSSEVTTEQAQMYADAFFVPGVSAQDPIFVEDILRTDGNARAGLGASIQPDGYEDEVEIVANMSKPLAVLHGKEEQLVNQAYIDELTMPTLWRGSVQVIEHAGHAPHWEQSDRFNQLLSEFLTETSA